MTRIKPLICAAIAAAAMPAIGAIRVPLPEVDNTLADCVSVKPKNMRLERGRAKFDADMNVLKPIGACGCTSAIAAYHASATHGEKRQLIQRGTFTLMKSGLKSLDLGDGRGILRAEGVIVQLMCAGA